jgi:hypothetical protein
MAEANITLEIFKLSGNLFTGLIGVGVGAMLTGFRESKKEKSNTHTSLCKFKILLKTVQDEALKLKDEESSDEGRSHYTYVAGIFSSDLLGGINDIDRLILVKNLETSLMSLTHLQNFLTGSMGIISEGNIPKLLNLQLALENLILTISIYKEKLSTSETKCIELVKAGHCTGTDQAEFQRYYNEVKIYSGVVLDSLNKFKITSEELSQMLNHEIQQHQ